MSNVVQFYLSVLHTVQNIEHSTGMGLTFYLMCLLVSGSSLAEEDLGKVYIDDVSDPKPESQPSS